MISIASLATVTIAGRLVADHLWQSTLFAGAAAALTLILRSNRAQVRYWLWMAASAKFLVPFAALAGAGSRFGWRWAAPAAQPGGTVPAFLPLPDVAVLIDAVGRPFSQSTVPAVAAPTATVFQTIAPGLILLLLAVWCAGTVAIASTWCVRWRRMVRRVREAPLVRQGPELAALRRLEAMTGMSSATPMVSSELSIEPGIFGFVKPVLVWPRGIADRLAVTEVEAILAHELCHVRRRDNLTALVHLIVEAAWWFHPLVWWVGARLVDERERACDEDVVRQGSPPQVYAESILKACRYFVESPTPCVAGVTGSNLRERVERIMRNRRVDRLNLWRRVLLASTALASVAVPVVIGAFDAPRSPLAAANAPVAQASPQPAAGNPTFEVASIKINNSGDGRVMLQNQPGRFVATNVTLRLLIRNAYQLQDFQISGGPGWIESDHFDVVAKIANGDLQDPLAAQQRTDPARPTRLQLMIRALLAERFQLAVHAETKELPVYALVLARSDGRLGPDLRRSDTDCAVMLAGAARGRGSPPPPPQSTSGNFQCGIRIGPGAITVGGVTLSQFANSLSMFAGRVVLDRTGLTGAFDANLTWTPDQMPQRPPGAPDLPIDPNGPSLFTAIREQLGLKLDSQKGPVEMLVIDRAEHPTEN